MIQFTEMTLILVQIIAVASITGLVGEFYRASIIDFAINIQTFIAQFSIIVVIASLVSFTVYYLTENRVIALILSAIMALQSDRFLIGMSRGAIRGTLKKLLNYVDSEEDDR